MGIRSARDMKYKPSFVIQNITFDFRKQEESFLERELGEKGFFMLLKFIDENIGNAREVFLW